MDVVEPATKAFVAAVNTAFKPAEVRPGLAVFVEQLQEARKVLTCPSLKGPAHDRYFTCAAVVDGEELGRGEGRTKKDAEQEAARKALAKFEATL